MLEPSGFYLGGVMKYVGSQFTIDDYKMFIMPHPSYVLRAMGSYNPPVDAMSKFINE
jgi:uracil-DNA glycosylase